MKNSSNPPNIKEECNYYAMDQLMANEILAIRISAIKVFYNPPTKYGNALVDMDEDVPFDLAEGQIELSEGHKGLLIIARLCGKDAICEMISSEGNNHSISLPEGYALLCAASYVKSFTLSNPEDAFVTEVVYCKNRIYLL